MKSTLKMDENGLEFENRKQIQLLDYIVFSASMVGYNVKERTVGLSKATYSAFRLYICIVSTLISLHSRK